MKSEILDKEITKIKEQMERLEKELGKAKKEQTFETCNGLMWSKTIGCGDWDDAVRGAKECRDGGFDDWRLPTISELQNVFDYERGKPKIGGFDAGLKYWSATTLSGHTHYAWTTFLDSGYTLGNTKTTTGYSYRCVR